MIIVLTNHNADMTFSDVYINVDAICHFHEVDFSDAANLGLKEVKTRIHMAGSCTLKVKEPVEEIRRMILDLDMKRNNVDYIL